jgi:hypothetical protein
MLGRFLRSDGDVETGEEVPPKVTLPGSAIQDVKVTPGDGLVHRLLENVEEVYHLQVQLAGTANHTVKVGFGTTPGFTLTVGGPVLTLRRFRPNVAHFGYLDAGNSGDTIQILGSRP